MKKSKMFLDKNSVIGIVRILAISILLSFTTIVILNLSTTELFWRLVIQMFTLNTKAHIFSLVILSVFYFCLFMLVNNYLLGFTISAATVIFTVLGNNMKIIVLDEPLYPSDLSFIKNLPQLMEMINVQSVIIVLGSIISVMTLFSFVIYYVRKTGKFTIIKNKKLRLVTFIVFLLTFILCFKFTFSYNHNNSLIAKLDQKFDIYHEKEVVHQFRNYTRFGFFNGIILNAPGDNIPMPDDYSDNKVLSILEKYQKIADRVNNDRLRHDFEDISIITILSESLGDPSDLPGVNVESPFEYITDQSDKLAVGNLLSPVYGGGTPNTEYELITSMSVGSLSRSISTAFQSFVSSNQNIPSIFKLGSSQKREELSIHSYGSHLYKRKQVYKSLGLDQSLFEADMTHLAPVTPNAEFVSDKSSYDELMLYYNRTMDPKMIHLVTMQNHQSYRDVYDSYDFNFSSDFITDQENKDLIKYYLQGLKETDKATRELIENLNDSDQKYILFFYGDHLPSLFKGALDNTDPIYKYVTKYFFASNIEGASISGDRMEYLSLTNVSNILHDIADVKISAFQALVGEINKEFSSIHREGYYVHGNLKALSYEELNAHQKELVDEYDMLQYDIIDGKQYSNDYIYYEMP